MIDIEQLTNIELRLLYKGVGIMDKIKQILLLLIGCTAALAVIFAMNILMK